MSSPLVCMGVLLVTMMVVVVVPLSLPLSLCPRVLTVVPPPFMLVLLLLVMLLPKRSKVILTFKHLSESHSLSSLVLCFLFHFP